MPTMDTETQLAFETIFGIPRGHVLRQVRCAPRRGSGGECWEWEHEEYDAHGTLVAVYESLTRSRTAPPARRADDAAAFVKYSPWGWVLHRSGPRPALPRRRSGLRPFSPPRSGPPGPDDRTN